MDARNIILEGIVGSTAYGLATEDSDIDTLGIFRAPSVDFLTLSRKTKDTYTSTDPDTTYHELGKYCRLALKCNPTVLELLYLPDSLLTERTHTGDNIRAIRSSFLSKKSVRDSYLGFATQQFKRLSDRGDGSFSSTLRNRTEKHARHLYRLLEQGRDLWELGTLQVALENPHVCRQFGVAVADGDTALAAEEIREAEEFFNNTESPLSDSPDAALVNDILLLARLDNLVSPVYS